MSTAEFSKFAGLLSAALSELHLSVLPQMGLYSKGEMLNEWQVKYALTDGDRLNGEKLNRMGLCGLAKEGFADQVTLSQI